MMTAKEHGLSDFADALRGDLKCDEPMARHTSWRVGGCADYFYTPRDKADLLHLLKQLPHDLPVHWVGLGSNLLVRDGGIRGMVIRTSRGLGEIHPLDDDRLYAESGVSCARVARHAMRCGLTGVEFLAGVPGSFGGALAMNAGAFGGQTWSWVQRIECVSRSGEVQTFTDKEITHGYRTVSLPRNHWIISGILALHRQPETTAYPGREKIRSLLEKRGATQPIQSANAGSVFQNPPGDFAARLIEACGLKGKRRGNAFISDVHANFIINEGGARASDIECLINDVAGIVRQRHGIQLDLEVRIIGEMA